MKFGERLKQLREVVGLSTSELALRAGVARQAIYQWEVGRRTGLSAKTAQQLADGLGVTVDVLLKNVEWDIEPVTASL